VRAGRSGQLSLPGAAALAMRQEGRAPEDRRQKTGARRPAPEDGMK
jgi:hypothetical protein